MTITFDPQVQEELDARAEARGISAETLVREAVQEKFAAAPVETGSAKDTRPIWEVILDNMKDVPAEAFDKVPRDGATQVDHYLYGHAKRYE